MTTTAQILSEIEAESCSLRQLVQISHFYGSNPDFVIAGGGNTSVKDDEILHVKASGTSLGTISEDGFAILNRAPLDELLDSEPEKDPEARELRFKNEILAARVYPERNQRPSVECVIHHLLPSRFVVHTHSTLVNALTCCKSGKEIAKKLFGEEIIWVEYVTPGFLLAKEIKRLHDEWSSRHGRKHVPAILMANHGLIICGDTPREIFENTEKIIAVITAHLEQVGQSRDPFGPQTRLDGEKTNRLISVIAPALRGFLGEGDSLKIVTLDDGDHARMLACGSGGKSFSDPGPMTPDQIVYSGSWPLWIDPPVDADEDAIVRQVDEALNGFIECTGCQPKIVVVKGVGILTAGDTLDGALTVADVYRDAIKVMAGACSLGEVSYLTVEQRVFIEQWEVESYRKKVSIATHKPGRATGKVALVTGAAQGFGLEIAQHLAREGAHVVLADLNEEGVLLGAREINETSGTHRAHAVTANVTDGKSLAAAMEKVIRRFGGVDILVANAGVVRAGSVKTMSEKDFDFVTDVNYKGYFLSVQTVAPTMAIQHKAAPGVWSDIIQINSKSGLVGSNKNGAYAGSKFGGIGLTQSFALELVEDGIKVNSICPGNFFDGPLWSDPEKGLFVQYLKSGKVPGAKSVEDVKRSYESKVPMGRGCRTIDVMRALFYIMDQTYETGQAIPVTGGQVMLS